MNRIIRIAMRRRSAVGGGCFGRTKRDSRFRRGTRLEMLGARSPARPGTPHIFNIALSKNTRISERVRAQFRFETFNSFNTPEFNNPRDQVGQSGFRRG